MNTKITTINKIISKSGYTYKELQECNKVCNGCGGKGGVNFEGLMKSLPYFNTEKGEQLFNDLHIICNIHDLDYNNGKEIIDFIRANFNFAYNVYTLIHWTKLIYRIILFIILFVGTTLFGYKYYNKK